MENTKAKTSLAVARDMVLHENPNLPMKLRFEVSSPKVIENLLLIENLLKPSNPRSSNIIYKVLENIIAGLAKSGFKNINIIEGDAIVSVKENFDMLMFSPGNPGRSSTYTRYVTEDFVLRTHMTALVPQTFSKLKLKNLNKKTFVFPGLTYRRDVIDPKHLDVFHQIDVWTLQDINKYGKPSRNDLVKLVETVFDAVCPDAEIVMYEADHPYTVDGIEVYARIDGVEIEVLEAGIIDPKVLISAGINPEDYSGLALGMGVERLIMSRKKLPDIRLIRSTDPRIAKQMEDFEVYRPVSNLPAIQRDLSYCISSHDSEEDICENIQIAFGMGSELIEEVIIIERTPFDNLHPNAIKRLGAKKEQDNVLVRIILRHPDRTLLKEEAAALYRAAYPLIHMGDELGYIL